MAAHVIPKEKRELLGEGAGATNVDMSAFLHAIRLLEVAPRPSRVPVAILKTERLERMPVWLHRVERHNGNLDVDDGLCRKPRE